MLFSTGVASLRVFRQRNGVASQRGFKRSTLAVVREDPYRKERGLPGAIGDWKGWNRNVFRQDCGAGAVRDLNCFLCGMDPGGLCWLH